MARSVTLALEDVVSGGGLERVDRVLLYGNSVKAKSEMGREWLARGVYLIFVLQLWLESLRRPLPMMFFDQLGPARSARMPLPGFRLPGFGFARRARYAVFCHGIELERAVSGNYREALVHAWRIVVNSEHTGRFVRAHFPELSDRIRVVPLCIEPKRIESWQALEAKGHARREPAALIVGRMVAEEPGKGHETLIDAWLGVLKRLPGACLWIVGEGDDRPRLEERVRERGLEGAVHFLGRLSENELADRYRTASVFAMPSRQEGFGIVYAEAMWHGLPCIASTSDAGAETVEAGETGLLVPYGDVAATEEALVSLLADPAHARSLGEKAARVARERHGYPRFRRDLLSALEIDGECSF